MAGSVGKNALHTNSMLGFNLGINVIVLISVMCQQLTLSY